MTPQEQELIKNAAVVAAGVGVITAAIVSSFVLLFNGWRQRVADLDRSRKDIDAANIRHLRGLALEAAIKSWDHQTWIWANYKRAATRSVRGALSRAPASDPVARRL